MSYFAIDEFMSHRPLERKSLLATPTPFTLKNKPKQLQAPARHLLLRRTEKTRRYWNQRKHKPPRRPVLWNKMPLCRPHQDSNVEKTRSRCCVNLIHQVIMTPVNSIKTERKPSLQPSPKTIHSFCGSSAKERHSLGVYPSVDYHYFTSPPVGVISIELS